MKRGQSGFTLIELLVVIAIIAILAAILFPIFTRMKIVAKQSQCISNIGQVTRGMILYAGDHGGRIPRWQDPNRTDPVTKSATTWDTYVYSYIKNGRVFTCPINCVKSDKTSYPAGSKVRSYSMPKNVTGVLYEQAPKPTKTVLLFEKGSNLLGYTSDAVAEWFSQTWGATQESPEKFWHGRGKVFAFVDGHAQYVPFPNGPFSYNYPSFTGWSEQATGVASKGTGYCGWCDNTGTAGTQFSPNSTTNLPGANIPR